jgi:ATP-dependent Lon protease
MKSINQKRKSIDTIYTKSPIINTLTKKPKLINNNVEILSDSDSSNTELELSESSYSESEISESEIESSDSSDESSSSEDSERSNDPDEEKSQLANLDNLDSSNDIILKSFDTNLTSIMNGEFFNIYPNKYNCKSIKSNYSIKTLETLNEKLNLLRNEYIIDKATIDNILNLDTTNYYKLKALEYVHLIANSDVLSSDYNYYVKELKNLLHNIDSKEFIELENKIKESINSSNNASFTISFKNKILKSNMSFNNKVIAYKYMQIIDNYTEQSSEELSKYKTWLNTLLTIPFGKYTNNKINNNSSILEIKKYLKNVRNILDSNLSFLEYPKDQVINIISQLVRNPQSKINAIGLYGNKGIGKTQFVESISNALERPLVRISLGGNSDVHSLRGHNFTYIGSKHGKIIDGIIDSKVMNPVFLFDEIDKISKSSYGSDITGLLIHLIDLTTNNKYNGDDYFSGIEFDLSRALFIFTYNDPNLIDSILADRFYKIKINNYTKFEKIEIAKTHLLKSVLDTFNFTCDDIIISNDIIEEIINLSDDLGMRDIKNKLHIIISRLNTLLFSNGEDNNNIITLKYKNLYKFYNKLPIILNKDHISLLLEYPDKNDTSYLSLYT